MRTILLERQRNRKKQKKKDRARETLQSERLSPLLALCFFSISKNSETLRKLHIVFQEKSLEVMHIMSEGS